MEAGEIKEQLQSWARSEPARLAHRRGGILIGVAEALGLGLAISTCWLAFHGAGSHLPTSITEVGSWQGKTLPGRAIGLLSIASLMLPSIPAWGMPGFGHRILRAALLAISLELTWGEGLPWAIPWAGMAGSAACLCITAYSMSRPSNRLIIKARRGLQELGRELPGWGASTPISWAAGHRGLLSPSGQPFTLHIALGRERSSRHGGTSAEWDGLTPAKLERSAWKGPSLLWVQLRADSSSYAPERWPLDTGETLPGAARDAAQWLWEHSGEVPGTTHAMREGASRTIRTAHEQLQTAGARKFKRNGALLSTGAQQVLIWPHPGAPEPDHPGWPEFSRRVARMNWESSVIWAPLIGRARPLPGTLPSRATLLSGNAKSVILALQDPSSRTSGTAGDKGKGQGDKTSSEPTRENKGQPRPPHEVLGLEPGSNQDAVKAAYRRAALRYHPDRVQSLGEEFRQLAEERMKEINEAYEKLRSD